MGTGGPPDNCVGLQCQIANCSAQSKSETSISGTVFAPNGTLPLYGINVYIPNTDPGPVVDGSVCARCTDPLPGNPVVTTISDENGRFFMSGIPAGDNIPLVITTGKWRRQLVIPHVEACTQVEVDAAQTRLPRDRTEGDIPKIAIATGAADSLECLIRKLGIADSEISTSTGDGRVQLYAGNLGEDRFVSGFPGGTGTFPDAGALWSTQDELAKYDIVMLSCEGAPYPESKPQSAMDAMKAYADAGGRVFASHWHNVWIEGAYSGGYTQAPADWPAIADWTNVESSELPKDSSVLIDEVANPKGQSFAEWMVNVGGSTTRDSIALENQPPDPDNNNEVLSTGRSTCSTVHPEHGEQWVYIPHPAAGLGTQNFQFTTPNNEPDEEKRCGKVVFSDMHVSGTSGARNNDGDLVKSYPDNCATIPSPDPNDPNALTPQEKALTFMFFDIASCVGTLF